MTNREKEIIENDLLLKEYMKSYQTLIHKLQELSCISPSNEYERLEQRFLRDYIKVSMRKIQCLSSMREACLLSDLAEEDFRWVVDNDELEESTDTPTHGMLKEVHRIMDLLIPRGECIE